jgi:putative addiction module killer protein
VICFEIVSSKKTPLDIKYLLGYNKFMYLVKQTNLFSKWLSKLKDIKGKVSILRRVDRMRVGHFGDYKPVGNGISELRIQTGPGYRVYYTQKDDEIIVLLVGGDKSSQRDDIKKANEILKEFDYE